MLEPGTFDFSQGKLQDYVDCARRFQLRYLTRQPSPALVADSPLEMERLMQRGADLHRLIHQHLLGLDPATLEAGIGDDTLRAWWHTYLEQPPAGLPQGLVRPEVVLAAPLHAALPAAPAFRLVARLDLLAADPGRKLAIVDWKTMSRLPERATLEDRLQTRVYRYLAVEAGAAYNDGQRPRPEQVEMTYWFAAHGGRVERLPYDAAQHAADQAFLAGLLAEILTRPEAVWPLTPDLRHCRFCTYRSLCERGRRAGSLEALEDDPEPVDIQIDLEQVIEIEF